MKTYPLTIRLSALELEEVRYALESKVALIKRGFYGWTDAEINMEVWAVQLEGILKKLPRSIGGSNGK